MNPSSVDCGCLKTRTPINISVARQIQRNWSRTTSYTKSIFEFVIESFVLLWLFVEKIAKASDYTQTLLRRGDQISTISLIEINFFNWNCIRIKVILKITHHDFQGLSQRKILNLRGEMALNFWISPYRETLHSS